MAIDLLKFEKPLGVKAPEGTPMGLVGALIVATHHERLERLESPSVVEITPNTWNVLPIMEQLTVHEDGAATIDVLPDGQEGADVLAIMGFSAQPGIPGLAQAEVGPRNPIYVQHATSSKTGQLIVSGLVVYSP